jgi:L-fuculose-phosphate aldolase
MSDSIERAREVIETARYLEDEGHSPGTSGNVSARTPHGMIITPSSVEPRELTVESLVEISLTQEPDPGTKPSSEWAMHRALYVARPEIGGVVHTHSRFATVLACSGKSIPSYHYMVAAAGGFEIPNAPYATFGTEELSKSVVTTIGRGNACLMANHGQITVGRDLRSAVKTAELVERLAEGYWASLLIGGPNILSEDSMKEVVTRFVAGYGSTKKDGQKS